MGETRKKQRTHGHVIADLSINYIEYYALKCGFSVESFKSDYGYDLQIYTYDKNGGPENGSIYVQIKATACPENYKRRWGYSYSFSKKHIDMWLDEPMPVIIVFYDALKELAYWVYVQEYLNKKDMDFKSQKTCTIHFDKTNFVDESAVKKWRKYKENILSEIKEVICHAWKPET